MALKELYDDFYNILFNYGGHMTLQHDLVEDCIQELFIELWKMHSRLSPTDSVKNYMIGAFRRNLVKKLQHQTNRQAEFSTEYEVKDESLHFEANIIIQEEELEIHMKLDKALQKLSSRQREAIFLRYQEGLEYEQICETMQLQYQSVRNLISTAILKLKENIVVVAIFFFQQYSTYNG